MKGFGQGIEADKPGLLSVDKVAGCWMCAGEAGSFCDFSIVCSCVGTVCVLLSMELYLLWEMCAFRYVFVLGCERGFCMYTYICGPYSSHSLFVLYALSLPFRLLCSRSLIFWRLKEMALRKGFGQAVRNFSELSLGKFLLVTTVRCLYKVGVDISSCLHCMGWRN